MAIWMVPVPRSVSIEAAGLLSVLPKKLILIVRCAPWLWSVAVNRAVLARKAMRPRIGLNRRPERRLCEQIGERAFMVEPPGVVVAHGPDGSARRWR